MEIYALNLIYAFVSGFFLVQVCSQAYKNSMSENENAAQLTYRIVHDIKNTLAVITMRCDESLKSPNIEPAVRNNLEQIKLAVESIRTFSEQLSLSTHKPLTESIGDKPPTSDTFGKETILVAEDEPQLRRLICTALRDSGYDVVEAINGAKALDLFRKNPSIPLIITDMTMPEMGGRDLALNAANIRSSVKVLYLSGFGHDETDDQINFLEKPFPRNVLLEKVKSILNS